MKATEAKERRQYNDSINPGELTPDVELTGVLGMKVRPHYKTQAS